MSDNLKPCPFCGSDAELQWYAHPEVKTFYWVACTKCRADTPLQSIDTETPDGPINFWNRRAPIETALVIDKQIASLKVELAAALADIIAYRRHRYADSAAEEARYCELTGHAYDDEQ